MSEHYITDSQHKQQVQQFNDKIYAHTQSNEMAWTNAMGHYEQYFFGGKINRETLHAALGAASDARAPLAEVSVQKAAYDKEYSTFRKLLPASDKRTPLSEIIEFIDKKIVDTGKWIVIKWKKRLQAVGECLWQSKRKRMSALGKTNRGTKT